MGHRVIYSDTLLRQRRDNTTARRKLEKISKKLLTKSDRYVNIKICHGKQSFPRRKRFQKKLLTNESGYDKISKLPLRTTATNERALAKQEVMIFDK